MKCAESEPQDGPEVWFEVAGTLTAGRGGDKGGQRPKAEVGLESGENPGDHWDWGTGSQEGLGLAGTWWLRVELHTYPKVL